MFLSPALVLALCLGSGVATAVQVAPLPTAPDNRGSKPEKLNEPPRSCSSQCKTIEEQCEKSCKAAKDGRSDKDCRATCKAASSACADSCAKAAPAPKR